MHTYDIIVAIHQTRKIGDKTKRGPESLDQFGAAAGVSHLSSRPEGPTLSERLPDGVEPGEYKIANVTIDGLHSTDYTCRDGMGRTVYCYTRQARLLEPGEDCSAAIDQAINSGVVLLVPGADGKRHEIEARVLEVSDMYKDRAPDSWTWSK